MLHDPSQVAPASAPAGSARDTASTHRGGKFLVLALGSVGVVFGDIGTSPLYALQTAMGQFKSGLAPHEVIGIVSLIIWALLIVVTAKYVLFLMMADNKGEGGILSLMALAKTAVGHRTMIVFLLGVAGSSLFPATRSSRPRYRCSRRWRGSSRWTPSSHVSSCLRPS